MLQNYFKMTWRNLIKNKGFASVNIFGLTIGLASCLLIGLFVLDELSYDTFHPDGERTYRVYAERDGSGGPATWAGTSPAIGPTFKQDFQEVEQTLRLFNIRSKQLFKKGDISSLEEKGFFAEASIFEMFHLPLLHGDAQSALKEVNSIVLTQPLAEKYFGNENPVGKIISINKKDRMITGVLKPLPGNFHLDFRFLVSFQGLLASVSEERINSWVWQDFSNYVKLYPETNEANFKGKLKAFVEKYAHPQTKELGFSYYLNLQKVKDVYLYSANFRNDPATKGNYQYVLGLSIVGLFLLFIACTNFINLRTAQAFKRAQEVGVRKVIGAFRGQLALQFMGEAIFIVAISMLLAAQLTHFMIPQLNEFAGKSLSFDWYKSPLILLLMLGVTLITGLISGAYPALVLSGFRPVEALKGNKLMPTGKVQSLRKGLVTLQYTLSILLIISTLVVFQQLDFLGKKELGFKKEQLLYFAMKNPVNKNFESAKAEFLQVPGVVSASTCFGIPGDIVSGDNIIVPGPDKRTLPARIFCIDHEYIQTMGLEIIAGRDFSTEIKTDVSEGFIVNETALKTLGLGDSPEEAIGKPLEWDMWNETGEVKKGKVIGVVKNFHFASLHEEVQTSILHIYPGAYWKLALRINTNQTSQVLAGISKTWDSFNTGYPIDYQFVDEGFGAMYKRETKLNSLLWIFTVLAILISCIGAFGLATYSAEQRRKEISIRKILGASTQSIVALLSKDFLRLVFLALIIASPIAWYAMLTWLENFAYRIDIQWWVFGLAGFGAVFITLASISFQSIRAASANPLISLKTE